jgi:membrane protein required for beta-lactamase induction
MGKAVAHWSDERLNDLAAALEDVPARVAVLEATVERLVDENRALRAEVVSIQRQLLQVAWLLVGALLGGAGALVAALI